jgi:Uma2 family endonuclease
VYQSIEGFCEYLLIAQERPHVIQYVHQPGGKWLRSEINGLEATLPLESLGFTLSLRDIYQRVTFQSGIA